MKSNEIMRTLKPLKVWSMLADQNIDNLEINICRDVLLYQSYKE